MTTQKLPYDMGILAETFNLNLASDCHDLQTWLSASMTLDKVEQILFDDLYEQVKVDGKYWNEEELKIRMIGRVFEIAKIDIPDKIKVFYERPLSVTIDKVTIDNITSDKIRLAVVADCLVATPLKFNTPRKPYFFLQEYKKGRGEAKDPEAQMLTAMLIAQEKNQDQRPIYGSYVIGSTWYFTTLQGRDYCSSRLYDAAEREEFLQIIAIVRKLKDLLLARSQI